MSKIVAFTAILILIISGLVVSYFLYTESEEQTILNQYNEQELYAHQAVLSISNFFENFKHSLQFISESDEIINFSDKSKTYLKSFFDSHENELKAVTRLSSEGKIVYTYPYVESVIGKDVSGQPHNSQIIKTQEPVLSDVFKVVQGYRAIIYAYPVFKDGAFDGCISILIPFEYIANKFLNEIKIGETGSSFVISEGGFELYCDQDGHIGKNIFENINGFGELETIISKMLKKENGFGEYKYSKLNSEEIVEKMVVYQHVNLENTFWSIAVIREKDEVLEAHREFITKLSALLLIVSSIVFLLLYFLSKQKKKSRLALHKKELKYKNDLEKLVEVRTKELNNLNKSLQNDISHRKKIQKELKDAIERVEKSEKLKSEFLAQMSHEIRTPINTILSFTSLIKEDLSRYASEDLKYGFQGIESAGRRLIRTIDLILNMSDLQLGTYDYSPKEIDLFREIIIPLESEYRVLTENKNLEFLNHNKINDTTITCDPYSVNQIFANLIDNAIKYTLQGRIEIVCSRNFKNQLEVSVIDTGVGISDEYLPFIFDEFSQEDKGYTRKFEGNGLGLSLVKKYCELNNAQIEVESTKGKGSKFTVTFNN